MKGNSNHLNIAALNILCFMVYSCMVCVRFSRRECGNLSRCRYDINHTQINYLDSSSRTIYTLQLWQESSPLYPNIWVFRLLYCAPRERGDDGMQAFCECVCMLGCFDVSALFSFSAVRHFHICHSQEFMNKLLFNFSRLHAYYNINFGIF